MNVLSLALLGLRIRFALNCAKSVLQIAGYALLCYIDWRIALGVFILDGARKIGDVGVKTTE